MSKTMIGFAVEMALCIAGKLRSNGEQPSKEDDGRLRWC